MYSAEILDHFQNPRHVGEVPDASASAEIENPACGDILRLSLKVQDGRIVDAGFRAKGCVPAIACGSRLAELVCGKTTAEAGTLDGQALLEGLGELPPASAHAVRLALDTLAAALKQITGSTERLR